MVFTPEKVNRIKLVARIITMISVSKISHDIIENNTTVETTGDSARVWIGSMVLGSMACDYSANYVNHSIDEAIDVIERIQIRRADNSNQEYKSDR